MTQTQAWDLAMMYAMDEMDENDPAFEATVEEYYENICEEENLPEYGGEKR